MKIEKTAFEGLIKIFPDLHRDNRGTFCEVWQAVRYEDLWPELTFVQDNLSVSKKGTLRGLHFQRGEWAQAKLVRCVRGAVYDVAVDLRKNSPTYLKWVGVELSAENFRQLLIPRGCAHGFLTLTDDVEFLYKADNFYNKASEGGIRWNDPVFAIDWKTEDPVVSDKDAAAPFFDQDENYF